MDNLISWLINYAWDHKIGLILTHFLAPDTPSQSEGNLRLIIINMEWGKQSEIPFSFAHEIGHILCEHTGWRRYSSASTSIKEENEANSVAIDILLKYCHENDFCFTNSVQFCEQFGIPASLEYTVALKLKKII